LEDENELRKRREKREAEKRNRLHREQNFDGVPKKVRLRAWPMFLHPSVPLSCLFSSPFSSVLNMPRRLGLNKMSEDVKKKDFSKS
jgi:hypothetical protein